MNNANCMRVGFTALTPQSALVFVLLVGWLIRGIYIFQAEFPINPNGAYYPVQARSILNTGWLAVPDLPFLFYFHAFIGWLFSWLMNLESALLLSTRLVDVLFPVLAAVPIYMFVRKFISQTSSPALSPSWAILLAGLTAVGNGCLIRMAGDFQKNAFALPLFLMYAYSLYSAFLQPTRYHILGVLLFFILVGITHIGVTALTLCFTVLFFITALVVGKEYKKLALIAGILSVFLILVLLFVSLYDSVRVARILYVLQNPFRMFTNSIVSGFFSRRGGPPGFGGAYLAGNTILAVLAYLLYRQRNNIEPITRTLLWSSLFCALFLGSPLIHFDLSNRFALMAPFPALIVFSYLILQEPWGRKLGFITTFLVLAGTLPMVFFGPQIMLNREGYEELTNLRNEIPEVNPIIVARHGLEWWVAWTMQTKITNQSQLAFKVKDQYDAVYQIVEINPPEMRGGRGPRRPPLRETGPNTDENGHPSQFNIGPGRPPGGGAPTPFFTRPDQSTDDPMNQPMSDNFLTDIVKEGHFFRLNRLREK